ncbi:RloB family protein [Persicobacter psychrovividus]|uniref:RloB domain-containing protein n=1 Tax=Persicobacter psychrovividus TaxID=387638 RepID=A0ABN6LH52_9BACT|nr:hypothetical protein PEPS_47580 [Persicobacter psychrovividus]
MGRSNRKVRKAKPKYSIIVDGETEIWYLQMLKQHENLRHIDIKPELPKKKKMADQYDLVMVNSRIYDQVIWLIDLDVILKEQREWENKSAKQSPSPQQEFKQYYREISGLENVHIFVNTPCLEFWYLLHLRETSRYFSDYANVVKLFKGSVLEGYEKSERYYKQGRLDLYLKLQPEQVTANNRATSLGNFDIQEMSQAKSEMFRLLEVIRSI